MDANSHQPEDLNALERRLSAWQPSSDGLDTDAMLFAAGRASARSGPARFAWPALTALLTVFAIGLSLWLADERHERLRLAQQLREHPPAPPANPSPPPAVNAVPMESPDADEPPPDSFLASRRALDKGLDAWPTRVAVGGGPSDPSLPNAPILSLGQRDALLEP